MSVIDIATVAAPDAGLDVPDRTRPAAPLPPSQPLKFREAWRAARSNPITVFPRAVYQSPMLWLGGRLRRMLVVSDPAAIEYILIDNAGNYRKSLQQQRRIQPALGQGLLTAEGETWRAERRIAAPLFSPKSIARLNVDMTDAAMSMAAQWDAEPSGDTPRDLAVAYQRLTYDIVSGTVFSGALDADRALAHAQMARYFDTIGRIDLATMLNLPAWVPTPAHFKARSSIKAFRDVVHRAVGARLRSRKSRLPDETTPLASDLLDRLLDARDPQGGAAMPDAIVADNVLTFLAAGHETTANALAWISYLLARFPWADERLAAEFHEWLAGRPAAPDDLARLPFARALIDEAMRLYPPAPFIGREAIAPDTLCGEPIPADTRIMIAPWVVHRHKRLWEEPDLFAPDRFSPTRRGAIPRGAFIPFGLGPRVCIGMGFALQAIVTVLSVLVPRYRFTLPEGIEVAPLSRITLAPRGGLAMIVTPRD